MPGDGQADRQIEKSEGGPNTIIINMKGRMHTRGDKHKCIQTYRERHMYRWRDTDRHIEKCHYLLLRKTLSSAAILYLLHPSTLHCFRSVYIPPSLCLYVCLSVCVCPLSCLPFRRALIHSFTRSRLHTLSPLRTQRRRGI